MNSTDTGDWRLAGQEKFLFGAILILRAYVPPRPEWDHDHCDFCWSTFCQGDEVGCFKEGYVTKDGNHWICPNCFADFRVKFNFTVNKV